MAEINQRDKTIRIKIVYYGPPVGGKTTNLTVLHKGAFWSRRGEMTSINSAQDRTILYDLLPLQGSGFRGFELKVSLVAVPGQVTYAASRRIALKGTDGVVFVANSAVDRWDDNIQSFKEMNLHLQSQMVDPTTVPLVFQYNKRDLPEVMPVESLDRALNLRKVDTLLSVASRGEGVLETFRTALLVTMKDLVRRYKTFEMSQGQTLEQWVDETMHGVFGKTSLTTKPIPVADAEGPPVIVHDIVPSHYELSGRPGSEFELEPPIQRKIRIAPREEADRADRPPSPPASRAPELLVESYAEASAELGMALADVREERNKALARLEQVRRALDVADEIAGGKNVVASLMRGLGILGEAGGTQHASFLIPAPGVLFRALLLAPLQEDPMIKSPLGLHCVESFRDDEDPSVVTASEHAGFDQAMEASGQPFKAAAIIPFRSPTRLLGFAILYYTPDAAQPDHDRLGHLGLLARILKTPLELAAERGVV